jgi:hypothetical protein
MPGGEYDIYAVGFQENSKKHKWMKAILTHLNSDVALLVATGRMSATTTRAKGDAAVVSPLGLLLSPAKVSYKVFDVCSLWDIHVAIFMRSDLVERVTSRFRQSLVCVCVHLPLPGACQTRPATCRAHGTEATGIAHVLGNKGSAAISFVLDGRTSFAFLSSHLAAQVWDAHGHVRK